MRYTRSLLLALALGTPGYGWLLLAPAQGPAWVRDLFLGTALLVLPVLVLGRVRDEDAAGVRPWLVPLTTGLAMFPLGHLVTTLGSYLDIASADFVGGVLVLVGYPFLLLGLLAALAQHVRGIRLTVCLDGLTGALAGAAVATLAIAPVLSALADDRWTRAPLLAVPLLDAVLVSASLGALALVGIMHGRQFGVWAIALLLLASAHLVQAYPVASGEASPPWSDALVVLALALVAVGALGHGTGRPDRLPGARALGVPALSSVTAVAVLTVAPAWESAPLPTVLALATLLCAAARFVRAFLQLRELAAVKEMALTDELTGIPNRRALYLHLDTMLELADDAPGAGADPHAEGGAFTVALIDLDHFKEVNDTLGHATGDALLKGVVGRFSAKLEELETPYLFARLGGDEFAVVLHEATSRNAALVVGEALQESLEDALQLPDTELHAQASIGLAVAPQHGRTRSEILFAADAAMYAAKTSGDRVRYHAPSRDEKTQQLTLSEDLHRAIDRRELVVEYQPIESAEGDLVAVEALVRWDHPERGRLLPGDFLPAAERYRLTGAVAQRVLDVALGDLVRWRAAGSAISLTLNLSPSDLRDEGIVSVVAEALLEHEVPASLLTLDIPEGALAGDAERVAAVLQALRGLGVSLALDDYGTGGTGLARLHELPFDALKLHGRFARDTAVNARSTGVVKSAIDLAHALGMRLVAEGVEDRRAAERLRELGCDLLQGWYVGRPGAATDVEERLARQSHGRHRLPLPEQSPRPDGAPTRIVQP